MIIGLPEKYEYRGENGRVLAEVSRGELIIRGRVPFRKIMYDLTYALKGRSTCFYCGREIPENKVTLDHLYPKDIGGPTVPDNMEVACEHCNCEKASLTYEQFVNYMALDGKEQNRLKRFVTSHRHQIRLNHQYELPEEWINNIELSSIIVEWIFKEQYKGEKYNNIREFYEKYGCFQKPIVVNSNYYLFDGFTQMVYARDIGLQTVPAIILENVKILL